MLALDAGNMLLHNVPDLARPEYLDLTADAFAEALGLMGYDAANLGSVDAHLPAGTLRRFAKAAPFPVLSANLRDAAGAAPFRGSVVRELPGGPVGIFGVASSQPLPGSPGKPELAAADPIAAARAAVAELRPRCRLVIALSSLGLAEDTRLAREVPGIDVILGSSSRTTTNPALVAGSTLILHAGSKGMRLGRLEIAIGPGATDAWASRDITPAAAKTYAWSLVALDAAIPDDPAVAGVLARLREELRARDIEAEVPTPAAVLLAAKAPSPYVGAASCGSCHPADLRWWAGTAHARAFATLAAKSQDANRDCLPCHVTAYGEPGGWVRGGAAGVDLAGVQCEACHGFGREHRGTGRIRSRVPEPVCRRCHTAENSPAFEYAEYRRRLAPHAGERRPRGRRGRPDR